MAKKAAKKTARGRAQDRAKVAGGQKYEVSYEAKKTSRSASAVKKAVKKVGNSRKSVEKRWGTLRVGKFVRVHLAAPTQPLCFSSARRKQTPIKLRTRAGRPVRFMGPPNARAVGACERASDEVGTYCVLIGWLADPSQSENAHEMGFGGGLRSRGFFRSRARRGRQGLHQGGHRRRCRRPHGGPRQAWSRGRLRRRPP